MLTTVPVSSCWRFVNFLTRNLQSVMASWLFRSAATASPINALLTNPETTLVQILEDSGLQAAMRSAGEPLCKFFTREDILSELFDWALTTKFSGEPNAVKNTRQAVAALAATAKPLQKALRETELFKQRLEEFPDSEWSSDPRLCGHYYRIIEMFTRNTQGEFVNEVPSIKYMMTKKMSCAGIRELFISIAVEQFSNKFLSEDLMLEMAKEITGENGFFLITGIYLGITSTGSPIIDYCQTPDFMRTILEAAVSEGIDEKVAAYCYRVASLILKVNNSDDIKAVVAEYAEKYTFTIEDSCNYTAACAADIFPEKAVAIMSVICDENTNNTFLNAALIKAFKGLDKERRIEIAEEQDLWTKVQARFASGYGYNGQVSQLAEILEGLEIEGKWNDEFKQQVKDRVSAREKIFGVNDGSSSEGEITDNHQNYADESDSDSDSRSDSDSSDPESDPSSDQESDDRSSDSDDSSDDKSSSSDSDDDHKDDEQNESD